MNCLIPSICEIIMYELTFIVIISAYFFFNFTEGFLLYNISHNAGLLWMLHFGNLYVAIGILTNINTSKPAKYLVSSIINKLLYWRLFYSWKYIAQFCVSIKYGLTKKLHLVCVRIVNFSVWLSRCINCKGAVI